MERQNNQTQALIIGGLGFFFLYTWISFILTPLAGDIKIFLASAKQASYISNDLLVGSFKVWELKSVLSRFLAYFLYKIACLFAPFNSYPAECIVKAVYSLLLIGIVFLAMKLLFRKKQSRVLWGTVAVSALFMMSSTDCHLQVEMTASLMVLLAFAFYWNAIVTGKRAVGKLLFTGVLIGLVFYLKSILLLLSVSVVTAVCISLKEKNMKLSFGRMMIVVGGSLMALAFVGGLILLINPSEFQEILNAAEYQGSFFSPRILWRESAEKFLAGHAEKPLYTPAILLGFVCLILNTARIIRERKLNQQSVNTGSAVIQIGFHLVLWAMPALFLLISDYYFNYHFAAYLFPAVFEIGNLIVNLEKQPGRARQIVFACAAVLAAGWYAVLFSVLSHNSQVFIQLDKEAYANNQVFLESIDFDPSATVLYLDDGGGAYTLGNPSALKYFFPLPLNRLHDESSMPCHVESLEKTLSYDGKYISVYDLWFFGQWRWRYENIQQKMENEYELLGSYDVFYPPHVILPTDEISLTKFELYQRK